MTPERISYERTVTGRVTRVETDGRRATVYVDADGPAPGLQLPLSVPAADAPTYALLAGGGDVTLNVRLEYYLTGGEVIP